MDTAPTFGFVCVIAAEGVSQLSQFLQTVRGAYPDAPVAVISDGWIDPGYAELCHKHHVRFVQGEYLKRIERGGDWWKRVFEVGLSLGTQWLVKVDPDARFWRPFRGIPPFPICGTLENADTTDVNIQGGCQIIHSTAAQTFLESQHLNAEALTYQGTFARDHTEYREWAARAYLCSDRSLIWLARHCGVSWGDWGEVRSIWASFPPGDAGPKYAVTHPHKVDTPNPFLEVPLSVITTCKGRLSHLRDTLPRWLGDPGVSVTVVDYNCPDGTGAWVRENYPAVRVVSVPDVSRFCLAHARNLGAEHTPEGWWCFLDADCLVNPGWSQAIRLSLARHHYFLARPIQWGQFGSVVVHSEDFKTVGGYDERYRAWGSEDVEFYLRLRQVGTRPGGFDGSYFTAITHSEAERTQHYDVKDKEQSRVFYDRYLKIKRKFLINNNRLPTQRETDAMFQWVCDLFLKKEYGAPMNSFYQLPVPLPRTAFVSEPKLPNPVVNIPGVLPVSIASVLSLSQVVTPPLPPVVARPVRPSIPAPKIVIVNRSSVISDSQGKSITDALQVQLDHDFASFWYTSADLSFAGKNQVAPLNAWWLLLLDDADQAGALGYHDKTPADHPIGKVFAKTTLQDQALVSVTVSHELLEMLGDPYCNMTATSQNADGSTTVWAYENCDACEDDRYAYAIHGTPVSDFVTPAYFDQTNPRGPFDHQGHISKPFEILPGGYLGAFVNGQWTQATPTQDVHHSSTSRYLGNRWHRRQAGRGAHVRFDGHAHRVDVGTR